MVLAAANQGPVDVIIVLSMVVPLSLVGVIAWVFWRAKKREDAARVEESSDPAGSS